MFLASLPTALHAAASPVAEPLASAQPDSTQAVVIESPSQTSSARKAGSDSLGHLNFVDGLRALAALYVVLHHAWLQVWPSYYNHHPAGTARRFEQLFMYGHFAVALFIVISGFCLMLPVVRGNGQLRGGTAEFLKRRARRILPPYYLSMVASLVLILTLIGHRTGTHWDVSVPVSAKDVLVRMFLLQDFVGGGKVNHVYWSIALEWQLYFLFPLLVLGWRRLGGGWTTGIALLVGYAAVFKVMPRLSFSDLQPHFLGLFALGMLAASIGFGTGERIERIRNRFPWGAASAICAALVIVLAMRWGHAYARLALMDMVVGLGGVSLLIAALRSRGGVVHRVLNWKPLVFVGGFSYSLYLMHAPLLQVVWQYLLRPLHLGEQATFLLLVFVGGPLIVGVSYLFYLVGEKPFINRGKSVPPARRSEQAGDQAVVAQAMG